MAVRMWASLPKDNEANGLTAIEKHLVDDPDSSHVVVAIINRKRLSIEDDAGETIPTARIVHIEPLSGGAADEARQLLVAALKERTGAATLPFEDE